MRISEVWHEMSAAGTLPKQKHGRNKGVLRQYKEKKRTEAQVREMRREGRIA